VSHYLNLAAGIAGALVQAGRGGRRRLPGAALAGAPAGSWRRRSLLAERPPALRSWLARGRAGGLAA
jgi:hypothetical protein